MPNFDDLKLAIEAMSGGKNTVLFDDMEMPSVMVPFPKMKMSDLIEGGSQNIHPAFSIGGVEKDKIFVSKFQNIVLNDRAYSLPMRDPKTYVTFDQANAFCRNKGKGWGLNSYALWSAIALWCRKNGTMPRGNNNWGSDHGYSHEKGVSCTYESDGRTAHSSSHAEWTRRSKEIGSMIGGYQKWIYEDAPTSAKNGGKTSSQNNKSRYQSRR